MDFQQIIDQHPTITQQLFNTIKLFPKNKIQQDLYINQIIWSYLPRTKKEEDILLHILKYLRTHHSLISIDIFYNILYLPKSIQDWARHEFKYIYNDKDFIEDIENY